MADSFLTSNASLGGEVGKGKFVTLSMFKACIHGNREININKKNFTVLLNSQDSCYRLPSSIGSRVLYRGGGLEFPPLPPPEILELSMVINCGVIDIIYLLDISMCHQMVFEKFVPDCIRSNLRGSKFKNFPGGGHALRPP